MLYVRDTPPRGGQEFSQKTTSVISSMMIRCGRWKYGMLERIDRTRFLMTRITQPVYCLFQGRELAVGKACVNIKTETLIEINNLRHCCGHAAGELTREHLRRE